MNKKGLTLIELLGVIIVLGIIAAISFPAINGVINNTRKDAFAQDANALVEAALTAAEEELLVSESLENLPGYTAATTTENEFAVITLDYLITNGYLEENFDSDYEDTATTVKVEVVVQTNGLPIVQATEVQYKNGFTIATSGFDGSFDRNDIID